MMTKFGWARIVMPGEYVGGQAWGNAIGGTVFPPVTLGLALYKNYFRG